MEIWKILVPSLLGWPVAVFALGLVFKNPLRALLGRINSIKGPGFDVSVQPSSAEMQLESKGIPDSKLLRDSSVSDSQILPATTEAISAQLEKEREAVRNYGGDFPILLEGIKSIERHLESLRFPLGSVETSNVLIRHLAVTQLIARCESFYRLIFGSQLAALHLMNTIGPQSEEMLRPLFTKAKTDDPKFYGTYPFDDWLAFLMREGAVIRIADSGSYAITVFGQNFLEYVGYLALPSKPH